MQLAGADSDLLVLGYTWARAAGTGTTRITSTGPGAGATPTGADRQGHLALASHCRPGAAAALSGSLIHWAILAAASLAFRPGGGTRHARACPTESGLGTLVLLS